MNCREEFLEHVEEREVLCAEIIYGHSYMDNPQKLRLPVGYNFTDVKEFLYQLNFEYDDGFGSQYVQGTVWYADGTWSERAEYDGSEWWAYKKCPEIPSELVGVNNAKC